MSSNYGFTSFNAYLNKSTELQSSKEPSNAISLSQNYSDASIFDNSEYSTYGSSDNYLFAYGDMKDQFYTSDDENSASSFTGSNLESAYTSNLNSFAGYENAVSGFNVDYSAPYEKILDNFFSSLEKSDETQDTTVDDESQNTVQDDESQNTVQDDESQNTVQDDDGNITGTEDQGESEYETEFTDEEQIAIYNAVEDILDATVRKFGTDEEAFLDVLSDENLTPKLMKAVQEELANQGYDIFQIIRSETSGSTEDVLEGYALAKLGGKTKESKTELESYERYQDMDKTSVEYQKYIRKCASLFRGAVEGLGTDEKVLTYIMSLPEDIRSDVEAKYNEKYDDDFMQRGKSETSGLIRKEFYN